MSALGARRCDHDPRRPRLQLKKQGTRGKPFPWLIRHGLERVKWLYTDRALFPELGPRKRSQRLEAMVLISQALLRNFDRLSLRIGRRHANGFRGISMKTIAGWTDLALGRAFRALWDLRDMGFLDCHQRIEKLGELPNGKMVCRGHAGVRTFRKAFFERLKLGARLRRDRSAEWTKARAEQTVQTIAQRRQLRRLFKASRGAAKLTGRTSRQLADRSTVGLGAPPPPTARVFTPAELAEMLRTRRR